MADNNEYNDEYELADFDNPEPLNQEKSNYSAKPPATSSPPSSLDNVRRNASVVIVLIILLMLGYKFWTSFSKKKTATTSSVPSLATTAVTQPPPPLAPQETVQPVQQPVPPVQTTPAVVEVPKAENSELNQQLSALEMSQQTVRSQVDAMSNQLENLNANLNRLTDKIATLDQLMNTLAAKVEQQTNQMAFLIERAKPKPIRQVVVKALPRPPLYYIQAIIPGRAWLIATNGSTITVREGTQIAGYGVVKLIDPNQGRVLTSSGQVIRFSQQDS